AVILLGFLVSLFELPCTGGIYLAILTMMSINKTFALSYLFLYNLIFVLPLVFITLIIYRGTSPEKVEKWREKERKWMKLFAGLIMVILGLYILFF
ncbi:MAG: cytochrome c biogenesis protein CcdA, partial [Candidatus Pacearchaeota archaeon]